MLHVRLYESPIPPPSCQNSRSGNLEWISNAQELCAIICMDNHPSLQCISVGKRIRCITVLLPRTTALPRGSLPSWMDQVLTQPFLIYIVFARRMQPFFGDFWGRYYVTYRAGPAGVTRRWPAAASDESCRPAAISRRAGKSIGLSVISARAPTASKHRSGRRAAGWCHKSLCRKYLPPTCPAVPAL